MTKKQWMKYQSWYTDWVRIVFRDVNSRMTKPELMRLVEGQIEASDSPSELAAHAQHCDPKREEEWMKLASKLPKDWKFLCKPEIAGIGELCRNSSFKEFARINYNIHWSIDELTKDWKKIHKVLEAKGIKYDSYDFDQKNHQIILYKEEFEYSIA